MPFDLLHQMNIVGSSNDNYDFYEEVLPLAMDNDILFSEMFEEEVEEEFSLSNYQHCNKERNEVKTRYNGPREGDFGNSKVASLQSFHRCSLPTNDKADYTRRTEMICGFDQHVSPPKAERRSVSPDTVRKSSCSSVSSDKSMNLSSMSPNQLYLELGQSASRLTKCIERSKASRLLVAGNVPWSQSQCFSHQGR